MNTTIYNFVKTSCLSAGVALGAVALTLAPAEAFSLQFSDEVGSTESTGSSALADFDFVQEGNSVVLNLTMSNTSNLSSTLSGMGWLNPDTSGYGYSLDANGTNFDILVEDETMNEFGTTFDVGVTVSGSLGGGSANGGLAMDESGTVKLTYSASDGSSLDATTLEGMFANMYQSAGSDGKLASGESIAMARFQQVGADGELSDKVLGAYFMEDDPVADVPEPGTILALGGIVFGAAGLRRKTE